MVTLAQILVLLGAVVGLYKQLPPDATVAQRAQIDSMATLVEGMAIQALSQPSNTTLGEVPTSSITVQSSTDGSLTVNVLPVQTQNPSPTLGVVAPEVPVTPTRIPWDSGNGGLVASMVVVPNATDYPLITQTSTIFHLASYRVLWDSATLTINGQTYNLPIVNKGQNTYSDIYFGIPDLQSGQTYPYTMQINAGNTFATHSDEVAIP